MGPYVTIDKLAENFSVSVSTVRNWIRQGAIPKEAYIKVGSTYRFNVREVEAALLASSEGASESVTVVATPVDAVTEVGDDWAEEPEFEEETLDLDEDY